ncbi:MAG: tetratricopeptide repeat protein [Holophagaceae bacterium]|nr:tetratricopeptide repeat protein [Holophagaceae bacterium]
MAIDRVKVKKEADKLLAAGRVDRAIDELRKLLDDNPKDLNLMNQIGDLCIQSGKLGDAVDLFKRAAIGYERDGFGARATAVLKKAFRHAPDDIDLASRLADLYRQTNMIKDALQVHMQVAEHFTKKGLIKRALEEFGKVVDLDPKNLKNKIKLADLYNKEGMKDKAAGIYLEVAEALAIEQMHAEASQVLERAKAMVSTPQVFLTQSRLAVIQRDLSGAAQHLREGLAANARSPELLEALAEIELQSKNPEKALEALVQMPQLPEKCLVICERALRELSKSGRTDEGLRLFKPIGREFARRGAGDMVAKAMRNALQGQYTLEAWIQFAEIAHQGGARADQVNALQQAFALATQNRDQPMAAQLGEQLRAMGITPNEVAAPTPQPVPAASGTGAMDITMFGLEYTEVDPLKRMQIQQLEREAETLIRTKSTDRALEVYKKILELDPANMEVIEKVADLHRQSGILTRVQMHYVHTATSLASAGKKKLALQLLDRAEQMFPGSTRLHRRTLGLDAVAAPAPAPAAPLPDPFAASAAIPMGAPVSAPEPQPPIALASPAPIALGAPPEDITLVPGHPAAALPLDVIIPLDLPEEPKAAEAFPDIVPISQRMGFEPLAAPAELPEPEVLKAEELALPPLEISAPEFDAISLGVAPPEPAAPALPPNPFLAGAAAPPPPPMEVFASDPFASLPSMDAPASEFAAWAPPEAPAPMPATQPVPVLQELVPPPFLPPFPMAPEPMAAGAVVDDELQSLLGDIDFQMDYGSPDEAKAEIDSALKQYPGHPELLSRLHTAEETLRKLGHDAKAKADAADDDFAHSFFDLTDVLGDALLESGEGEEMHDATNVVEKIQSVDELFNAFREGVEQQVRGDDYDTHYNLGIAYKEMMLLEPAIEEFKKAMRDPERTLECCSMLSICEESQGNLEAALDWLKQGINAPGFPPEDSIGLRYDLGEMLAGMGREGEAMAEFKIVAEIDPEYREIASKPLG